MGAIPFDPQHAAALLRRTPRVLRALLDEIPDQWTDSNYGPDTFSPREVVGHLILGERIDWIPRARIILEHGEDRPFDPFPHTGVDAMTHDASIGELLDTFEQLRAANVDQLFELRLSESDLDRRGTHPDPALGRVTLRNLIAAWVVHDQHHLAQIDKGLARQYQEEVGPWRAYIGILNR